MKLTKIIDSLSFENGCKEFIDITYHIDGYIDIKIDTSERFSISEESEIDEICNAMKELLRQHKENNGK